MLFRCFVPECDSLENAKYDEGWVQNVLPGSISESSGKFQPDVCSKFIHNGALNDTSTNGTCLADWFNKTIEEKCDSWVFNPNERTIVNDVR